MTQLTFALGGDAYRRAIEWRRQVEFAIVQYQIENRGKALVAEWRGQAQLQFLTELPQPGEAVPWLGDFGGGYSYLFRPGADRCWAWAECRVAGVPEIYPQSIAPLNLGVTDRLRVEEDESTSAPEFEEDVERGEMTFRIVPRDYRVLARWPLFVRPPETYMYHFTPTKVGLVIGVADPVTGKTVDLTRYEEW